jgi:formylmethanofuran dehydrogenase subunit B
LITIASESSAVIVQLSDVPSHVPSSVVASIPTSALVVVSVPSAVTIPTTFESPVVIPASAVSSYPSS